MGLGMALNLQKHLKETNKPNLYFSNRSLSKGDPLAAAGGVPQPDYASLVKSCDIIFTMISNDTVLDSLVDIALSLDDIKGKVLVDTSTVHPETAKRCAEKLAAKGAVFIASPVFGASGMATAGKLIFAMAGKKEALEEVKPLVQGVMGRSIIDLGDDVGRSSLLKIAG